MWRELLSLSYHAVPSMDRLYVPALGFKKDSVTDDPSDRPGDR
jgi:hypothetical protein